MKTLDRIVVRLLEDVLCWLVLLARSTESVRVENLVLRRQLAMFLERGVRPHRLDAATRVSLAVLSRLFDWRRALVVVQPATMVRWHRMGWRLLIWSHLSSLNWLVLCLFASFQGGRDRFGDATRALQRR